MKNMDGFLWPGQSAAFTLDNNGVTDSAGFVNLRVRHGQRFDHWPEYQIEARAATAGSERLTTFDYRLSAAEADADGDRHTRVPPESRLGQGALMCRL